MKINRILRQHRRDFVAEFECEHCGRTETLKGYDDTYFHRSVIPEIRCGGCGKVSPDDYRPLEPRYADGQQL